MNIVATPAQITAAREWIADAFYELDGRDVAALPERAVIAGVNLHYDGGWRQFVIDSTPVELTGHHPLMDDMTWLEQHSILAEM